MLTYASGYPNDLFLASDATTTALKAGIREGAGEVALGWRLPSVTRTGVSTIRPSNR